MSLIKQIQDDRLAARKAGDTIRSNLLTTLFGEASKVGKDDGNRESTDVEVTQTIKKFIKNGQETLAVAERSGNPITECVKAELLILVSYLPKQLGEAELRTVISNLIDGLPDKSPKQMGAIMKSLTTGYAGLYDGQLASKLVKEMLA